MKIREFICVLLEYDRAITRQRMGDKLVLAAQRDRKQDIETILSALESMDPSANKKYTEWLARQYANGQFRLEDYPRITDVLKKFENIKRRLEKRDINQYTFRSLEDTIDTEYNVELKTDDSSKSEHSIPDVKVLYKGSLGTLSIPETEKASCELGRGTKWCTAARENNMFDHYNAMGPLYVWRDKNGEKYQFHWATAQFMNSQDEPISYDLLTYFREKHPVLSKLFKREEATIANDAGQSYDYAYEVIRKRFPAGEPAIASNYTYVFKYIYNVLDGDRFPEYEKLLFAHKNIADMINYVVDHLYDKPRIPEIEQAILRSNNQEHALNYTRRVIDGPWPEAEEIIAQDSGTALSYAQNILDSRFPAGEAAIATNAYDAFDYAKSILEGPFPAGEMAIAKHPELAVRYAIQILGEPFYQAEPAISRDYSLWMKYVREMKKLGYNVEDDEENN